MASDFDAVVARRQLLLVVPNPRPGIDYLIDHEARIETGKQVGTATIAIRFVPDQDIVSSEVLRAYLGSAALLEPQTLEDLGQTILGDLNSELVPRWVHVAIQCTREDFRHSVILEDCQPRWKNPSLLGRLAPV